MDPEKLQLKKKIYNACIASVDEMIQISSDGIKVAREGAEEEARSSAGDKYETAREMMQQEIERNAVKLKEAQNLKRLLLQTDLEASYNSVQEGAIIQTNLGTFFISAPVGNIKVDGNPYVAISSQSPIAQALHGKKVGESIVFNNRTFQLLDIF